MGRFYDHIPEKLGWVEVVQYALTGETPVPQCSSGGAFATPAAPRLVP
jgi:hypothetical protein